MSRGLRVDASRKTIGLKDLAAHLSLHPSTVSVVLNDVPGRTIPQATRDRVKAAARSLGYAPNILARSLRTRETRMIGVLLPDVTSSYHAEVLSGIAGCLVKRGYACVLSPHAYDRSLAETHIRSLTERGIEGLVVVDTLLDAVPPLPLLAIGCPALPLGATSVEVDHRRAAILALEYLASAGHRTILMAGAHKRSVQSGNFTRAFRDAASSYGVRIAKRPNVKLVKTHKSGDENDGEEAVNVQPVCSARIPSAVVALDEGTFGTICDLAWPRPELACPGLRVLIEANDDCAAGTSRVVIRPPLRALGQMAAETLLRALQGDRTTPTLVAVEPELVML